MHIYVEYMYKHVIIYGQTQNSVSGKLDRSQPVEIKQLKTLFIELNLISVRCFTKDINFNYIHKKHVHWINR